MDFNTQRKAVAAVESFGRKYKILYPLCMLAVLCIALFCSAVRAVDMALSDDDGRFLGMNRTRNRRRKASESKARVSAPAEKRGFLRRAVSGILSLCFAVMVVPAGLEIVSFAASSVATADQLNIENGVLKGFSDKVKNDSDFNYANTLDIVNGEGDVSFSSVAPSAFYGNTVISSIDLTGVKSIGLDAFKNATSLTRVIIDGRDVTFSDRDRKSVV